jgi:hypothetical protein
LENFEKNLDEVISPFFSQEELEILARESGFVKRTGKITGSIFLELIIFNSEKLKAQSLNDLSVTLNQKYQIDMTKQSLNERFNENAVTLVQMALEKMLNSQIDRNKLFDIEGINRILVKDSVCFQLDESFADKYPGSGGSASKAAVRIQFEYDLLNGKIIDLSLNPYTRQDATDYVLIDFKSIYHELKTKQQNKIEKIVYLGKEKLKVRLFIYLMPEEEYARRIRKALKRMRAKQKARH